MPDMKSMKLTSEDRQAHCAEVSIDEPDYPYPYGLRLHLEKDALDKLGIDMMPEVGAKRVMMARVEVVSTNKRQDEDGTDRSIGLQITDMALHDDIPRRDAEKVMYGDPDRD